MKRQIFVLFITMLLGTSPLLAARPRAAAPAQNSDLRVALRLAKSGNYAESSKKLFALSIDPRYNKSRLQIKYLMGLTLYQLHLYQTAAFQFVDVIRSGESKYLRQSLERLSLAADELDNDTLLNYAISRIKIEDFPAAHQDMLYYRIGEYKMRNKMYDEAARSFGNVRPTSNSYFKARYMEALSRSQNKEPAKALAILNGLLDDSTSAKVTDTNRVAALMGKARVLYQGHQWDDAIEAYREVPRDTPFWHDALFESSWAMFRAARFRSALGNFQSLHSTYYENFYMPEGLLLRALVYLYICKYDEMQKTLDTFEHTYSPIHHNIVAFLNANTDPMAYFLEIEKAAQDKRKQTVLPFLVSRKVMNDGEFKRDYGYIKKLRRERTRIDAIPGNWKNSGIGHYAKKIVEVRLLNAKKSLGYEIRNHLITMQGELRDFFEQSGFLRYEQLNGMKTALKKKIAGQDVEEKHVDDSAARSFYIKNGYEYWPFRGEYWLDEIGNYHYVGVQSCE